MKKAINSFILWMIYKFGVTFPDKPNNKVLCGIKNDKRFVTVIMPNGEEIPGQTKLTLVNNINHNGIAEVSITLLVNLVNL